MVTAGMKEGFRGVWVCYCGGKSAAPVPDPARAMPPAMISGTARHRDMPAVTTACEREHATMTADSKLASSLVTRVRHALNLGQEPFADRVGSSLRTVARWEAGESVPADFHFAGMAKAVHPVDRALAAEVAAAAGKTLHGLGLEPPPDALPRAPAAAPPAYPVTPRHLVTTVLCSAAEALDMSPGAMRPALAAMLRTMCELGLSAEVAEQGLREPEPSGSSRPRASPSAKPRPPPRGTAR
jgi:DNA-binding transcriptional regulator YiaG